MQVLDRISMVLRQKGNVVISIRSDASVYSAIEMMAEKQVGALLVIEDERLRGVISERDYARKVILKGRSSKDTLVRDIMTESPITIALDASVDEAMRIMTTNRIRHLPVLDAEGHVVGVLSIGDLVNWILTSQDETIEHLERYISGGHAAPAAQR
jgi:CBS domain-containing protein